MYRIYARTANQSVVPETKTTTASPAVAEHAFRKLMWQRDLWCQKAAAVLSLNNKQLEYRRFDRIIPDDETLAERVRKGEPLPDRPKYLYPMEQEALRALPAHEADRCIVCYVKPMADTPIFDDEEPIRLFHDCG